MFYQIAADIVIVIHFIWIAFVILGFPVSLWLNSARWRLIHLAAVIWMVLMQVNRPSAPSLISRLAQIGGARGGGLLGEIHHRDDRAAHLCGQRYPGKDHCTPQAVYLVLIVLSFWFRPIARKTKVRG